MGTGSLHREMTRVAGALYALGGALLVLAVLVPHWPDADTTLLLVYAAVAGLTAGGLELAARHRPLSLPQLMVVAVLGIAIITLAVLAGGPDGAGALAVFHVFVVAYGFFYFPRWWAIVEVVLIGISYGVALAYLDVPGPASQWVLVTGSYAGVGAVFGSISQRVREALESELRSVTRLRELDEMKTTFLRAVSHELRTPLTNIVGYTTTLQAHRDRLGPERSAELLDAAVRNARKLEQLLTDLLDVDRIARGIVTPNLALHDVGLIARNVAEHLDFGSHPIHVVADPVTIRCDGSKVERIIENLLVNAIRHTGAETPIWLSVSRTDGDDGGARIVVEDAGPGVPDALKNALFEPFAQGPDAASSATPGTGIGLSLVLRFVHLHDGTVWIEDRPGGGARFCILLPDAPDLEEGPGTGVTGPTASLAGLAHLDTHSDR